MDTNIIEPQTQMFTMLQEQLNKFELQPYSLDAIGSNVYQLIFDKTPEPHMKDDHYFIEVGYEFIATSNGYLPTYYIEFGDATFELQYSEDLSLNALTSYIEDAFTTIKNNK